MNILDIGKKLNLDSNNLELYGNSIAKVKFNSTNNHNSNLILLTAINPTPYGEGKTTVSIGLNDALWKLNKKSIACLREPSLGPVFGLKGGATGGGKSSIIPEEEINLHFTGDFHAITSANNLLAAAIDNHIYQGNELDIDINTISFKRCLDINDRSLRDKFNITAASEVMAIFCLAKDLQDLKRRLSNILVAYSNKKEAIYAKDLKVDNAMYKLLEKAFLPNLVQSMEENPVLVHGGPFANIAHGCSSLTSIKLGLNISDYVVTEAGFGSDLGCEKFIDIVCRKSDIKPNFIVLVATIRALIHNGIENFNLHIDNLKHYNIPFCVAINLFSNDKKEDIEKVINYCHSKGIECIVTDSFNKGGEGSLELAKYIINNTNNNDYNLLYNDVDTTKDKIISIVNKVYKINNVEFTDTASKKLELIEKYNFNYPICMAKTQYAYSSDVDKVEVKDIIIQTGSEMLVVLLDNIITMPGLPKHPNFENM